MKAGNKQMMKQGKQLNLQLWK